MTVALGEATGERLPRARLLVSSVLGVVGVVLFTLYADRANVPWTRVPSVLGVLATACGWAYAVALVISPAPRAITLRHFAAGSVAALLAFELSGGARRMGLGITSDGFRVLWAPITEELCKTLLLAAVWATRDERRDRSELVTAAVAVGAGFALRENYLYFIDALGTERIYLEWVLLRAVPPVLAHCAFGIIQGGVLAHLAVHARATGETLRRFSWPGFVLAALVHVTYNFVALLLTRVGGSYLVELTMLWSLVALAVALVLRVRVRSLALADEPPALSMAPPAPYRDRAVAVGLAVLALTALCWVLPIAFTRYLGWVLTPAVLGWALVHFGARALRVERAFTAVVLGLAVRPLVRGGELLVLAVAAMVRKPALHWVFEWLMNAQWVGATVALTYVIARKRGPHGAIVFASGVATGMAGSFVGSTLASVNAARPGREMLIGFAMFIPKLLALGAVAGLLTQGRDAPRRAVVVTALVSTLAVAWNWLSMKLPGPLARPLVSVVVGVGIFVALVAVERARGLRAGVSA